jgi:aspartate racemase
MKTLGIIGGVGPESTIEYYRSIIASYRESEKNNTYPSIIINSVDLQKLLNWMNANELAQVADYLVDGIHTLARAGADFGIISAGTPHIVFDDVRRRSPIPLISIVEVTCDSAKRLAMKTVGLMGTRFTMQGRFFSDVFSRDGIQIVVPNEDEQSYIHDKYFGELVKGVILEETRDRLVAIVERMKNEEGIEGLILGGTELSLILRNDTAAGIPLLDSTKLHVEAVVRELVSSD